MPDSLVKEPPRFNADRSYERYENEVDAWSNITTVDKAKQGTLLVFSLPDSGKYGDLKGKVMDVCEYQGETGLENVKVLKLSTRSRHSWVSPESQIRPFENTFPILKVRILLPNPKQKCQDVQLCS